MLKPETIKHSEIAQVSVSGSYVTANVNRQYQPFIDIMKARHYYWDGACWRKQYRKFESPTDRAAELCSLLLQAGFCVDCSTAIAEKLTSYTPAKTRVITAYFAGEHAGKFSIWWDRQEDFYKRAMFLPGAQYDGKNKTIAVPAEFWNEVKDFAELHQFEFSERAQKLLDTAPEAAVVIPTRIEDEKKAAWRRPTLGTADQKVPERLVDAQYIDFNVTTELLPHQVPAVEKVLPLQVGALLMDMGLGKTRTAIQLAWKRRHRISSVVWLCPASLKETILHELTKHTDCTSIYVFDEHTTVNNLPGAFWYIVGLESVGSSDRVYLALEALLDERSFVIVDESSYIKGYTAKRTRRLTQLCTKVTYKLLLTGTPLSQGPEDLYAQMTFLDGEILGYNSFYSFAANHLEYHPDYPGLVVRAHNTDYLASKMAPYVYQITKEECIDLPEKLYHRRYYALTELQQEFYHAAKEEILLGCEEVDSYVIFKLFTALQQIVSGFWKDIEIPHERVNVLLEELRGIPDDEKVIIWCKYVHSVKEIAASIPEAHLYYGEMNTAERSKSLAQWRDQGKYLVITLGTGGHGLTLTEAAYAVYYEQGFKYSERIQSEDRIHRIGQTRRPTYIDIFAECGIEDRIEKALDRKENVVAAFKREMKRAKAIELC
jgi:SNF2 family DNA or RNA helicase